MTSNSTGVASYTLQLFDGKGNPIDPKTYTAVEVKNNQYPSQWGFQVSTGGNIGDQRTALVTAFDAGGTKQGAAQTNFTIGPN